MGGFNGTRKIIDIAGDAGETDLMATGPVRYIEIEESPITADGSANTLQGFQYQLPNDSFTQWQEATKGETVEIGDPMALRGSHGSILGNGPNVLVGIGPTPATVLAKLRSATGTGTSVTVTQHY